MQLFHCCNYRVSRVTCHQGKSPITVKSTFLLSLKPGESTLSLSGIPDENPNNKVAATRRLVKARRSDSMRMEGSIYEKVPE